MLERAENEGFEWQKRTKTPILCSGMVAASSALPATSPAECIWQQCARQQIAATYHATCRRACYREQAARLPAAAHAAVALQPRNYRKKATAGTPVAVQPVAVHAAATCCQDLPAAHTTVHTPGQPTCRSYYRAYRCSATAEEMPPCMPPGHTTLLWGPRPAGG